MIQQLIPAFTPLWQVSAGPAGEVVFTRCVCIALAEDIESGERLALPMVPAEVLRFPDADPNHVGYSADENPEPWIVRCGHKLAAIIQAEKDAAGKPQIIVPARRVVTAKDVRN